MSPRLSPPAASFIREHEVRIGDLRLRAGMDRPTEIEGWWLAVLWVADDEGIVPCRLVAPAAGPPPDPPHARLGPLIAGGLSGFVLEDDERQQLRLRLPVPPDDADRPWSAPLVVQLAVSVGAGPGRGHDVEQSWLTSRWRRSGGPWRPPAGPERGRPGFASRRWSGVAGRLTAS